MESIGARVVPQIHTKNFWLERYRTICFIDRLATNFRPEIGFICTSDLNKCVILHMTKTTRKEGAKSPWKITNPNIWGYTRWLSQAFMNWVAFLKAVQILWILNGFRQMFDRKMSFFCTDKLQFGGHVPQLSCDHKVRHWIHSVL